MRRTIGRVPVPEQLSTIGQFAATLLAIACSAAPETSEQHDGEQWQPRHGLPLQIDLNAAEGAVHIGGGDDGSGFVRRNSGSLEPRVGVLTPDELSRARAAKDIVDNNEPVASAITTATDWRTRLPESVRATTADEPVRIYVELFDQPFPWHEFRNRALTQQDRNELIAAREGAVAASVAALENRLRALGASDIVRFWVVPAVSARIPAKHFAAVASWQNIAHASRDDEIEKHGHLDSYRVGTEGRLGMRSTAFIEAGYYGSYGHRNTADSVRIGIYDSDWNTELSFLEGHYGFDFPVGERLVTYNCGSGTCTAYSPPDPAGITSHGTIVMNTAAGSIEAGQDPNISSTASRRHRSGVAPLAKLWFMTAPFASMWTATAMNAMYQRTISDAIDVMNHSYSTACVCDRSCEPGTNTSLLNSTNAGTLHITSANNGNTDNVACTTMYPATRSETLAVGGLNTLSATQSYDTTTMLAASSRGGMDIRVNGVIRSRAASVVDLVAPGCYNYLYSFQSGSYGYGWHSSSCAGESCCGTSLSAPSVSGNAALALHSFYSLGYSAMFDPRLLRTYLLMMGDGWGFDAGGVRQSGKDWRSGAGRLKNHFMSGGNLAGPWGFGCHKTTITNGQTHSYSVGDSGAESTSITTWKAALTWREDNMDAAADLDLLVYNTCPAGGGPPQLVAWDNSYDLDHRIRLTAAQIGGRCLQYRVNGFYVPSGGREYTVCDYYQSGPAVDH